VEALGKESESGQWLVVFLVEKVVYNLSHWSSEESLAHTSILLLQSVAKSIPRSVCERGRASCVSDLQTLISFLSLLDMVCGFGGLLCLF